MWQTIIYLVVVYDSFKSVHGATTQFNNFQIQPAQLPRLCYSGAAAYDEGTNKIYLIGGYAYRRSLIEFDVDAKTFDDKGANHFPQDVTGWGQFWAQKDTIMWMVDVSGVHFDAFDVTTQTFSDNYKGITIPNTVQDDGCIEFYNDYLIVIGYTFNRAQILDTTTGAWQNSNPMHEYRQEAICAVANGEFYAIGGYPSKRTIEYLKVDNMAALQNEQWTYIAGFSFAQTWRWRTVNYNGKILIVGGCCGQTADVFTLDPILKTVTKTGSLAYATHSAAPIIVGDKYYVFGGSGRLTYMTQDVVAEGPTDGNQCEPDPCENGGVCTDGVNSYTCNCDGTGFSGDTCQVNIDDCATNPCQNGGVCTDGVNSYTCNCDGTGFSGENCRSNCGINTNDNLCDEMSSIDSGFQSEIDGIDEEIIRINGEIGDVSNTIDGVNNRIGDVTARIDADIVDVNRRIDILRDYLQGTVADAAADTFIGDKYIGDNTNTFEFTKTELLLLCVNGLTIVIGLYICWKGGLFSKNNKKYAKVAYYESSEINENEPINS